MPYCKIRLALFAWTAALMWISTASAASPEWNSHAGDHDFAPPRQEGIELTDRMEHIRLAWSTRVHTGFGKGGGGSAVQMLEEGFEPAYGETAGHLLSDGVLLVSWSRPSGKTTTDLSKLKHRYYNNKDENRKLRDTYFRIDADWHTMAFDADTGDILWERVEPSASINFLSNKRNHNGISGAARDGLYVTVTMMGRVFAYDIHTGKTRWSYTLEDWNKRAEAQKAASRDNERITSLDDGPFGHKRYGAVIVDDLVILPDLDGGLLALKTEGSTPVWHRENVIHAQASPRIWNHQGKTWLICSNDSGRGGEIHLLDPATGEIQWTHPTGANPGELLMGDDHLLLNTKGSIKKPAPMTAYEITLNGLRERWTFPDQKEYALSLRPDFGAHRKGVIRDGRLYIKLGSGKGIRGRMAVVDLKTGKELSAVEDPDLGANAGQPFMAEDKLYLQKNSAHSGGKAGLYVYQIENRDELRYLGDLMYKGLGISVMTDYQYPMEYPYAGGLLYLRGKKQIAAVDLRTIQNPMAEVDLEGLWAGFRRPVDAVMFANEEGEVTNGRLEAPPRAELGVVGTSAYRNDSWTPLTFPESVSIGKALETDVEFHFVQFSWDGTLAMEPAEGDQWHGVWSRHFPGWKETATFDGTVHESSEGGYTRRGWPTGWLKDRPVTFFSDLPDGQERAILQLHGFIPSENRGRRNMTLCLDHDGETVVAGIGGGFSFNQSYHEIETDGLKVTDRGISGTALVIINSDPWVPGDYRNDGGLAGRLTLDLTFGEANDKGVYPVRGDWSVEWGLEHTRRGPVRARLRKQ